MPTTHIVQQGECLSSIAYDYKLSSWQVIYNDPHNAAFKAKRPDPNVIYAGDELFIPDLAPHQEDRATDQQHVFVVTFPPTFLNLRIKDQLDRPITGASYDVVLDDITLTGQTDDDGWIRAQIPAPSELGLIRLRPNPEDPDTVIEWEAKLGHLNPMETVSGVKGRLTNLGYPCGEIDDETEDDDYTNAVMQFQTDYNLTVDGIVGPQTRGALKREHQV